MANNKKLAQEMTTQIKAEDSKVLQTANSVAPTSSDTILPGSSAYGTNNNSIASAVADKAQGSEVKLHNAEGRVSIGETQRKRIEFIK